MSIVLMNTVTLDDGMVIKKGSGGGGVTINNQSKSVDITENGTSEVRYDAGYTGLEKVSINVNVVSDNDIAETDAEVCRVFFNAGLCANENYITKEEAARITDLDMVSFSTNRVIQTFNGFKYFTSVKTLPDELFLHSTLSSIELPEGLTSIGVSAFQSCGSLQSIELPAGLTSIGDQTFASCSQLNSIELPAGLTSIGGQTFVGCVNLTKITSLATTAPNADATAFGPNVSFAISQLVGRKTYNTGENILYVPAGATGYDTGAWLDPLQNPEKCGFTIKYQGEINNQDKSIDIVENGTTEIVADSGYTGLGKVTINTNVASSGGGDAPSRPSWTGHADADGLRAIGWTDDDIAYYQEHGVNWNAEDDENHKVTDDNKALYGVLTADNISTYANRIVYLPKIDTSAKTIMAQMFKDCYSLVGIPQLDTSSVTNMNQMFNNCYSLVSIPQLDTSKVTSMNYMFDNCYSLVSIPQLDTSNVTSMSYMFQNCYSLVSIPQLDTSKVTYIDSIFNGCNSLVSIPQLDTANVKNMGSMFKDCRSLVSIPQLDTSNVTSMSYMFQNCYSLVSIPQLDTSNGKYMNNIFSFCYSLVSIPQLDTANVTEMSGIFSGCYSLTHANLKNAKKAYQFSNAALLSKESLLYLINNEAAPSAITIKLASYAYTRLANDADIVAALAAHPNISISK